MVEVSAHNSPWRASGTQRRSCTFFVTIGTQHDSSKCGRVHHHLYCERVQNVFIFFASREGSIAIQTAFRPVNFIPIVNSGPNERQNRNSWPVTIIGFYHFLWKPGLSKCEKNEERLYYWRPSPPHYRPFLLHNFQKKVLNGHLKKLHIFYGSRLPRRVKR